MDSLRVSFLGRTLPNRFVVKTVVIHVGRQRFYERSEWRDALVVLEQDTIDIECVGGSRTRFAGGPVVCFDRCRSKPCITRCRAGGAGRHLTPAHRGSHPATATSECGQHVRAGAAAPGNSVICRWVVARLA